MELGWRRRTASTDEIAQLTEAVGWLAQARWSAEATLRASVDVRCERRPGAAPAAEIGALEPLPQALPESAGGVSERLARVSTILDQSRQLVERSPHLWCDPSAVDRLDRASTSTAVEGLVLIDQAPMPPPTQAAELAVEHDRLRLLSAKSSFALDLVEDAELRLRAALDVSEAVEMSALNAATEQHEAFVLRPSEGAEAQVPAAMLQLGELYFQRSVGTYLRSIRDYEAQLAAFDRQELACEPEAPRPDYGPTIDVLSTLLRRFGAFAHADVAGYLLGFSYLEQGDERAAAAAWQALASAHPSSPYAPEALSRVGDFFGDGKTRGDLERAAAAYAKVVALPENPYWAGGRRGLAVASYRLGRLDEALRHFLEIIEISDRRRFDARQVADLPRDEAARYIVATLADRRFGGPDSARAWLESLPHQRHAQELSRGYARVLRELGCGSSADKLPHQE